MARHLGLSPKTINYHLCNLRRMFGAYDSVHLMGLAHPGGRGELAKPPILSKREFEVICLRMRGMSLRETARHMRIQYRTTGKTHTENIRLKLGDKRIRTCAALILNLTEQTTSEKMGILGACSPGISHGKITSANDAR
jgi:DNA-binding CsgD family transcriptional regulator